MTKISSIFSVKNVSSTFERNRNAIYRMKSGTNCIITLDVTLKKHNELDLYYKVKINTYYLKK